MNKVALLVLVIADALLVWRTVRGMLRGHFASDLESSWSLADERPE